MDGGNKVALDLEAGLDVNTSDMLVPLSRNTWQHNWQKYQGKFLPNSLRFEKNGWAVGWDVIDFDYNNVRVKLAEDLYANCVKINDTPMYMIGLFNAEASADVLKSYMFNDESKVLSVDRGSASFISDQELHCAYSGVTCNIIFDPVTKELSIDNDDLVLVTTRDQDTNSYRMMLVKRDEMMNIDVQFRTGSSLSCAQFINDLGAYDGYTLDEHSWYDGKVKFDGSTLLVNNVSCNFTQVDTNTVQFDFDEEHESQLTVSFDLYNYVESYEDLALVSNKYAVTPCVSELAPNTLSFNRITCDFSASGISEGDTLYCDIQVPIWLTATFKVDIDYSRGAWEPDNTMAGNILFGMYRLSTAGGSDDPNMGSGGTSSSQASLDTSNVDTVNPYTRFVSKSVFDDKIKTGYIKDLPNLLEHRYNVILLGNRIEWKNPLLLRSCDITNEQVWYKSFGKNTRVNDESISRTMEYWGGYSIEPSLGSVDYHTSTTIKAGKYFAVCAKPDPSVFLTENDIFNDETCATVADVSDISSIKKIGTLSSTTYRTSDEVARAWEILEQSFSETLWFTVDGNSRTFTLAEQIVYFGSDHAKDNYSEDDTFITSINDIYSTNMVRSDIYVPGNITLGSNESGHYKVGTYISIDRLHSLGKLPANFNADDPDSDGYFPFKEVPCFNASFSDSDGSNPRSVKYAFAVFEYYDPSDHNIIRRYIVDDFNEFRDLIFGTKDTTITYSGPVSLRSVDRTRKVYIANEANKFYDFDKFGTYNSSSDEKVEAARRTKWQRDWNRWYPGVPDPQNLIEVDFAAANISDEQFLDFNNIEVVNDAEIRCFQEKDLHAKLNSLRTNMNDQSLSEEERQTYENEYDRFIHDSRPVMFIRYTQPGIVLYSSGAQPDIMPSLALSCFNSLGIIPWKSTTNRSPRRSTGVISLPGINITDPETGDVVVGFPATYPSQLPTFNARYDTTLPTEFLTQDSDIDITVYHNTFDATELYNTSASGSSGTINCRFNGSSNVDGYIDVSVSFAGLSYISNHIDINGNTNEKNYVSCDFSVVGATNDVWSDTADVDIDVSCTGVVAQVTGNDSHCLIDSIQVSNGNLSGSSLKTGLDTDIIRPFSVQFDHSLFVLATCAIKGHAGLVIKYNEELAAQQLVKYKAASSGDSIDFGETPAIEISKDTNRLQNKLYINDDSDAYCVDWFDVYISAFEPLTSLVDVNNELIDTDKFGRFKVTIEPKNNAGLFYAETATADSIYFPPFEDSINGGMSLEKDIPSTYVTGIATGIVNVPIDAQLTMKALSVNHKFYKKGIYDINTAHATSITAFEDVPLTNKASVVFTFDEDSVTFDYDIETDRVTIASSSFDLEDTTVDLTGITVDTEIDNNVAVCEFDAALINHFTDVKGSFTEVRTLGYQLIGCTNNEITFETEDRQFTYINNLNRLQDSNTIVNKNVFFDHIDISFIYGDMQIVEAIFNHIVDDILHVTYKGVDYEIDTVPFFADTNDTMSVKSTDIRTADTTEYIGDIDASKEYQVVKQQWDSTSDTENFWWIDHTHILVLTNQELILKHNTLELDDWNGNRWEDIYTIPRTSILELSSLYYTTLNVYDSNDPAIFMVIREISGVLRCTFYDVINKFAVLGYIDLMVHNIELGDILNASTCSGNAAYLNTYSTLTGKQILAQAKWSNTIRDDKIIIGCHVNNNFDQWTIVIDKQSFNILNCVQGYGFVSVKGDLTGGQIPGAYFNKNIGFNSKVDSLESLTVDYDNIEDPDAPFIVDTLHESDINTVVSRVVGTADRQYYICKELSNIVSHLVYTNSGYEVKYLPITNKFDAVYKSPSYISEFLFDYKLVSRAMSSLFEGTGAVPSVWHTFVSIALDPDIWLFAPKFASITYLQQTLGQYAYVHYNSTHSPENKDTENDVEDLAKELGKNGTAAVQTSILTSDEITFDKQIVKQEASMPFNERKRDLLFLFNVFLPAIKAVDNHLSINEGINETTISDCCKAFTQTTSENITELLAKTLHTDSPATAMTSSVVGLRSLDMFYSTSDNQRVFAGPGFVEHQFVADCVAQSVTDVQMSCYVEQLSFVIKILSTWKLKLAYLMTKFVNDMAEKAADYTAQGSVAGTSEVNVGIAIGLLVALQVAMLGMRGIMIAQEEVDSLIGKLADAMKADNIDSAIRSKIDTEAKHKYGEKNEYFLWPCFGIPSEGLDYHDETVVACAKKTTWMLDLVANRMLDTTASTKMITDPIDNTIEHSTMEVNNSRGVARTFKGDVPLYVASCYGRTNIRKLPKDMAKIEGVSGFLPAQSFKNKNIGVSEPVFTPSLFHDYIIDDKWQLAQCATYSLQQWVTCKDTKLINCAPSNMIISNEFCGIAAPYTAIEVKRGLSKAYMRPWAITPNVLALNCTGFNTILDNRLYHAFDGVSYRITDWTGTPGINKNTQTFLYSFQLNDRFKRSNKFPANEVQGNFDGDPGVCINSIDKLFVLVTDAAKQKGLEAGAIGEDKDATRWALPVFTERVATMPAAVRTLSAMQLNVYDGVTALTTNIMNNQTAYKVPTSIDFTIGKNTYRCTNDYICLVQTQQGIDILTELVPILGLTYIGSTLTEAYFYSKATRFYYVFAGGALTKVNMLERFRDIKTGSWDFINHEIVMPCLITYNRLDKNVLDNDTETDNIIVPTVAGGRVSGELPPPLVTIFNDRSWYKVISLPSGLAYQGPNRVIINRSVFIEYMLKSFKKNLGKWVKLDKEHYDTKREYSDNYNCVDKSVTGVDGWTHNPFVLVTSSLGQSEDADCLFEWTITFCWPVEMDLIYGPDNYAVVNVMSETMTPGGKVTARPTHIYLTKELFTRSGNYGYYSFTYQSKNGSGNRERLHIWSDQYIAISNIVCESKVVSQRRTSILTQQIDVQGLKEL